MKTRKFSKLEDREVVWLKLILLGQLHSPFFRFVDDDRRKLTLDIINELSKEHDLRFKRMCKEMDEAENAEYSS